MLLMGKREELLQSSLNEERRYHVGTLINTFKFISNDINYLKTLTKK